MESNGEENHKGSMIKNRGSGFRILFYLTIILSVLTVVSGWAGFFDPENWWLFSITGFLFPFLLLICLILVAVFAFTNMKLMLIPLVAVLLTLIKIPALFQLNDADKVPEYIEDQSVEVSFMSYNVRLFDLYNWSNNNKTRTKIFDFLEAKDIDIISFQEFYSSDRDNLDNVKAVKKLLGFSHHHVEYPINKYTTDHYGIATFSKFPIVNTGILHLEKGSTNICIFSDIKIDTDTVRIYNCHLQSVRFENEDYKFIEDIRKSGQDTETIKRTRTILGRLKRAFIKRAAQAEMIATHISKSPHPVIICGDFNDTALSYSYNTIAKNLKDAFRETGRGFGSTYAGPIPGLRIDYILHSREVNTFKYKTHRVKLSDHYPIQVSFVINP